MTVNVIASLALRIHLLLVRLRDDAAGQDGARFYAAANIAVSLVAGVGAAAFGWFLGLALR